MARKITSLILKFVIALSATVGITLQTVAMSQALLYFTIQSNAWIAATCIVGIVLILMGKTPKRWMYSVKLVFTVSITLTGVVYCTLLAPYMGEEAFNLGSTLLHVIVPVAAVADFFLYDCAVNYKKWECLVVTVPPFYYLAFAGVGYALNWDFGYGTNYPYFFLDWGSEAGAFGFIKESPYLGTLYYVLILLVFVIGIGALYTFTANAIYRKIQTADAPQN